ncbi:MAG TPA: hypothetical protein VGM98_16830 [Schlesneria sp.]
MNDSATNYSSIDPRWQGTFDLYRPWMLLNIPREILEADEPSTFDQYRERVSRERMKSDEKQLRYMVIEREHATTPTVRELGNRLGIHPKRVVAMCEKWIRQGWYDCGVSADLGWVSDRDAIPRI